MLSTPLGPTRNVRSHQDGLQPQYVRCSSLSLMWIMVTERGCVTNTQKNRLASPLEVHMVRRYTCTLRPLCSRPDGCPNLGEWMHWCSGSSTYVRHQQQTSWPEHGMRAPLQVREEVVVVLQAPPGRPPHPGYRLQAAANTCSRRLRHVVRGRLSRLRLQLSCGCTCVVFCWIQTQAWTMRIQCACELHEM